MTEPTRFSWSDIFEEDLVFSSLTLSLGTQIDVEDGASNLTARTGPGAMSSSSRIAESASQVPLCTLCVTLLCTGLHVRLLFLCRGNHEDVR